MSRALLRLDFDRLQAQCGEEATLLSFDLDAADNYAADPSALGQSLFNEGPIMDRLATPAVSFKDNLLLSNLSAEVRDRLMDDSRLEHLDLAKVLFEPGQPIEYVYFPLSGVISLVTILIEGDLIEMATVGCEGLVGAPMTYDPAKGSNARGVSQIEGDSIRVPVRVFRTELARSPELAGLVNQFSYALFSLVGQNAACNRLHNIEKRCARWLLMTRDRVEEDRFHLTQEFLSQMLGARRASVTEAAAALQEAGAISYARGEITIRDRAMLEGMSCECYDVVRRAFDRLYGDPSA